MSFPTHDNTTRALCRRFCVPRLSPAKIQCSRDSESGIGVSSTHSPMHAHANTRTHSCTKTHTTCTRTYTLMHAHTLTHKHAHTQRSYCLLFSHCESDPTLARVNLSDSDSRRGCLQQQDAHFGGFWLYGSAKGHKGLGATVRRTVRTAFRSAHTAVSTALCTFPQNCRHLDSSFIIQYACVCERSEWFVSGCARTLNY